MTVGPHGQQPSKPPVEFVCPRDQGSLAHQGESGLVCLTCGAVYPLVRNTPVFICDERSVFAASDYKEAVPAAPPQKRRPGFAATYLRRAKRIDAAVAGRLARVTSSIKRPTFGDAVTEALKRRGTARVLVIGSGGHSYNDPRVAVVCTDVQFGPHVSAIVDAHDLPFPDGSFDLVASVAVLEHVADPQRCVAESWRVLAPGGVVFAVTPFLEGVHMGAHDFTRFTPLGHRRLFRFFTTIDEGVAMGAGSMLGYAWTGFLTSLWDNRWWRNAATVMGFLTAAPLRKLDRHMAPLASRDNAAGCYFLGARSDSPISDRELIGLYKGGFAGSSSGAHDRKRKDAPISRDR